ncbi:DNA polymerase alpha subunit B [Vanrija pseudolonga]|uniref:DNA polymerase alpha subunit B n=1 Tax=Vanrija pseudolonga TaxID=143232 RepID=A0AAF0Y139_9TREE|nr:DNA polymerase alpha subunit B [Vanrija pseudolonga]
MQCKSTQTSWQSLTLPGLSILRVFGLSAQDLWFKYEAFLLSRPAGLRAKLSKFNIDVARELRKEIQRESQAKAAAAQATPIAEKSAGVRRKAASGMDGLPFDLHSTPVRPKTSATSRLSNVGTNANLPSPGGFATPSRSLLIPNPTTSSYRAGAGPSRLTAPAVTPVGKSGSAPSSPVSGGEGPSLLTAQPPQPFAHRANPHSLVETLNGQLSASTGVPEHTTRARVKLSATEDPKDWDYRYMFEKISARSEALDEQIDQYAENMIQDYGLTDFGDPSLVSDDVIYTVGRILSPPTDNNKATAASLYLQPSRMIGGGKLVQLTFAPPGVLKVRGGAPGVRGFGVYPGAIVCVKGKNGGGDAFVVEEVLMPAALQPLQSLKSELVEFQQSDRLGGLPISVHVAAGPYTLEDNLDYEPLDALVDVACDERPDVVILLGPFVDASHPHILNGKITSSPTEIFREQIASRIARINEVSPATIVILIPSVKDLISRHVAYPQAMLEREGLGLSKAVKLLPNPCTFSINEISIALASTDVLFHLRREEVFQRAEEADPDPSVPAGGNPQGDAIANAVRHVLGQRHFYPLFPAPENVSHEVNLDVTHWNLLRLPESAPDVLILPSKLKHFSKVIDSSLVVNPGHLSKPHAGGTFAKLTIHPTPPEVLGDGDVEMDGGVAEHSVWERARSEVWRV